VFRATRRRIDDKGDSRSERFPSLLESKYGRELFLTSLTGEYVRVYPMPVWLEIEAEARQMPSTHPVALRFSIASTTSARSRARCAGPRARSRPLREPRR
jgi:hypothetical protein